MKDTKQWPSVAAQDSETIWSEAVARRLLDEWAKSGESLAAFARRRGFLPQRLSWWSKRLASVKPGASMREAPARPAFIPVTRNCDLCRMRSKPPALSCGHQSAPISLHRV